MKVLSEKEIEIIDVIMNFIANISSYDNRAYYENIKDAHNDLLDNVQVDDVIKLVRQQGVAFPVYNPYLNLSLTELGREIMVTEKSYKNYLLQRLKLN